MRLIVWVLFSTEYWRDIDSERRRYGVVVWSGGGEMNVGKRLYRWKHYAT